MSSFAMPVANSCRPIENLLLFEKQGRRDHIWGTLAESYAPLDYFNREIARAMNAAIALPVGAGSPLLDEAEFTTRKSSWKPHNLSRPLPAS
jgi:hypothetical protein